MSNGQSAGHEGWRERVRAQLDRPLIVHIVGGTAARLLAALAIGAPLFLWKIIKIDGDEVILAFGVICLILGSLLLILLRSHSRTWRFAGLVVLVIASAGISGAAIQYQFDDRTANSSSARPLAAPTVSRSPAPPPTARLGSVVRVPGLRMGECANIKNLRGAGTASDFAEIASCTAGHDGETFLVENAWQPGQPYPGDEKIEKQANARCERELAEYVGFPYHRSVFEFGSWFPDAGTWRNDSDRQLVCVGYHPKQVLRSTIKGLRR